MKNLLTRKTSKKEGTITHKQVGLTGKEIAYLNEMGLSREAVRVYDHLLRYGSQTAQVLSMRTLDFPSAQYRLLYQLEDFGLILRLPGRPRSFRAIDKPTGLQAAFLHAQRGLRDNLGKLLSGVAQPSGSYAEILIGRQVLYERYIDLATLARSEVWSYAIGIAYSAQLERVQKSLAGRGVTMHHVVQQLKPSNYHVVHKWLRIGMKVRHAPSERGLHFTIFDRRTVIITFSDPEDTENRLSIVTDNPVAARLFTAQFLSIWAQAKTVDI